MNPIENDVRAFLEDFETRTRPLDRRAKMAWWNLNTTGEERYQHEAAAASAKYRSLLSDRDDFKRLESWRNGAAGLEPRLKRQVEVLHRAYRGNQVDRALIEDITALETELERDSTTFRGTVGGEAVSDNDIEDILRAGDDPQERREAWEASRAIGAAAAPKVVRLAMLRNRAARSIGFRDHFQMSLDLDELPEEPMFSVLDDLRDRIAKPFARVKARLDQSLAAKFNVPVHALFPWHYHDRFFQEAPAPDGSSLDDIYQDLDPHALTERFFDGIGMDIRGIAGRSDLYARENKCQHAFCIMIEPGDVRVLCNLTPTERWTSTNLHEFGHAVYDQLLGEDLPWTLLSPAHQLSTEAVAIFMERFSTDEGFLSRVAGVAPKEARRLGTEARETFRMGRLIFLRWALVMVNFEREFYKDPERADLSNLWWDLVEDLQQLRRPENRDAPDWAAKIHIACAPVYYQNYIFGNLLAAQLRHAIAEKTGGAEMADNPAVGEFFRERLFRHGCALHWDDLNQQATGQKLSSEYLARELGAEPAS